MAMFKPSTFSACRKCFFIFIALVEWIFFYLFILGKYYNLLKKGRLALHKIKIVRLIKVKSEVNVNVTKTIQELRLILILYLQ